MSRLALVLILASLTACASSPTAPTPADPLAGAWSGTLFRGSTSGSLRLDLQTLSFGTALNASGRYELVDASGTTGGTVTGGLVGTQLSLTLTPTAPPSCPGTPAAGAGRISLLLTLDGSRLSGEAVLTLCAALDVGTVTLTRP